MQFSMYNSCLRANSEDKIVEDNLLIQDSINNWMIVSIINFIVLDLE